MCYLEIANHNLHLWSYFKHATISLINHQNNVKKLCVDESLALFVTSLTNQLTVKSFLHSGSSPKSAPFLKSATPSNQATTDLSPSCQSFRRSTKRLL